MIPIFTSLSHLPLYRTLAVAASLLCAGFVSNGKAANILEGAENGLTNVSTQLPAGFNVLNSRFSADAASHSFRFLHLGFTPSNQWITLNDTFVAGADTELRFKSMLGLCDTGEMAVVQVSNNNGQTWANVYTQTGVANNGETAFQQRSVSLGAFAGQSLRLRFLYSWNGVGGWFWQDWEDNLGRNSGWYVDQIEVRNGGSVVLSEGAENGLSTVSAQLPSGFDVINRRFSADTASNSFRFLHLGFTPSNQWLMLNASFVAATNSEVRFKSMLGLSDTGEMAAVQISNNGGQTWTNVYTQTGFANSGETAFSQRTANLGAYAGQTLRLRFLYSWNGVGSWFWQDWEDNLGRNSGWYVDQIEVRNVELATSGTAPAISQQPASQAVTVGGSAIFRVVASGTGTMSYQWRKNGTPISGATGPDLNLSGVGMAAGGSYSVVITNPAGSATSQTAMLSVYALPVVAVTSPSVCAAPSITVAGTITNPLAVFSLRVNGVSVTTPDGFATWTVPNVSLAPGRNILTIAFEMAGAAALPTIAQWEVFRLTESNLLTYAFNRDPNAFDSAKQPKVVSQLENGVPRATFVFSRLIQHAGIAYVVEVSENLSTWRVATTQEVEELNPPVANADGVTETVTLRIKEGSPQRFVRLSVSVL